MRSVFLVLFIAACSHSRPEPLRPHEEEPPKVRTTLPDGRTCTDTWLALEPDNVCRVSEAVTSKDGKSYTVTFRTVECGAKAAACGTVKACDCRHPIAFLPCSPGVPLPWPFEEGRTYRSSEVSELLARERTSSGLAANGSPEGATCPLVINPPEFGKCSIVADRADGSGISHAWSNGYVPFGETREVCGVPVSCTCDQFKPE